MRLERVIPTIAAYFSIPRTGFEFNGRRLDYFRHPYNRTWCNERCVEIPLVLDALPLPRERKRLRVLELGRVLPHYFPAASWFSSYECIDKTEAGAENVDAGDIIPYPRWDLIIAISTLEHIGWDEEEYDPLKIFRVLDILKACLLPGGRLLATVPHGQNRNLDAHLRRSSLFDEESYFRKNGTEWRQHQNLGFLPYNHSGASAWEIIFGSIE